MQMYIFQGKLIDFTVTSLLKLFGIDHLLVRDVEKIHEFSLHHVKTLISRRK